MLDDIYSALSAALSLSIDEMVFSSGSESAEIMLVGEAPGRFEVAAHTPFVGQAGKNLDEFLAAIALPRESLFITNAVKFRPTKTSASGGTVNRAPVKREIELCAACLRAEIERVAPKLIVTLGNTALFAVAGNKSLRIGDVHGKPILAAGTVVFPLYHPASIIYNRALKAVYEDDLRALRTYLNSAQFSSSSVSE